MAQLGGRTLTRSEQITGSERDRLAALLANRYQAGATIRDLVALRTVSQGAVTVHDGGYVRAGRPVGGQPAEALVRLHTAGHLAIGPPGSGGHRPVQLTVAGAVRLAELGGRDG